MKQFMDQDFLLSNETAKKLFHDYAEPTPILDYHCHIGFLEKLDWFGIFTIKTRVLTTLLLRV